MMIYGYITTTYYSRLGKTGKIAKNYSDVFAQKQIFCLSSPVLKAAFL